MIVVVGINLRLSWWGGRLKTTCHHKKSIPLHQHIEKPHNDAMQLISTFSCAPSVGRQGQSRYSPDPVRCDLLLRSQCHTFPDILKIVLSPDTCGDDYKVPVAWGYIYICRITDVYVHDECFMFRGPRFYINIYLRVGVTLLRAEQGTHIVNMKSVIAIMKIRYGFNFDDLPQTNLLTYRGGNARI